MWWRSEILACLDDVEDTQSLLLANAYRFRGFHTLETVRGLFCDPYARLITLVRRGKGAPRDLQCGNHRIYLDREVRRVHCRRCGTVKREQLATTLRSRLNATTAAPARVGDSRT